jgi:tetratricopeptide (TPR) repeat protein
MMIILKNSALIFIFFVVVCIIVIPVHATPCSNNQARHFYVMAASWEYTNENRLNFIDQALALDSSCGDYWVTKAAILNWLGRNDESISAYDQALSHVFQDTNRYSVLRSKGDVLYQVGMYQDAISVYNDAYSVSYSGTDKWLEVSIGDSLYQLGKYQDALDRYNKALTVDPTFDKALSGKTATQNKINEVQTTRPTTRTVTTSPTPWPGSTPRSNDFPDSSSLILIIIVVGIIGIIAFLVIRKKPKAPQQNQSLSTAPTIRQQQPAKPAPPIIPQTVDLPDNILLHIDRLAQSQPRPLEVLDRFYAFLELEGFTLTPELKDAIKKKIESILDEKEKTKKKQQISAELFGTPATTTSPLAPQLASGSQVTPLPTVPPGSTCQVCLSEFSSAEPGAVKCPHCGNLFHYRCIAKWVNKNGTCPVCKKDLKA